MPSETVFRFKDFNVFQGNAGLKVNTDAVILGAWLQNIPSNNILEIGCGTGVISAILAHRFPNATINAIDINNDAIAAAQATFKNHPNHAQLHCFQQDVLTYTPSDKFDVLVCNPPYFDSHQGESAKSIARQQISLSYTSLIQKSGSLITENAQFYLVIPFEHLNAVHFLLLQNLWYLTQVLAFADKPNLPLKRVLICAQRSFQPLKFERISLFDHLGAPTNRYHQLVAPLYETMPKR